MIAQQFFDPPELIKIPPLIAFLENFFWSDVFSSELLYFQYFLSKTVYFTLISYIFASWYSFIGFINDSSAITHGKSFHFNFRPPVYQDFPIYWIFKKFLISQSIKTPVYLLPKSIKKARTLQNIKFLVKLQFSTIKKCRYLALLGKCLDYDIHSFSLEDQGSKMKKLNVACRLHNSIIRSQNMVIY